MLTNKVNCVSGLVFFGTRFSSRTLNYHNSYAIRAREFNFFQNINLSKTTTPPLKLTPHFTLFLNLFKPSPKKYTKFPMDVLRNSSESPQKVLRKSSDSALKVRRKVSESP